MKTEAEEKKIKASEEKNGSGISNLLVLIMSAVFVLMASLMIFVSGVRVEYLCYAVCAAAVIAGIVMIVRYFMTDAYRNMNAYGFSFGTLLTILGICGFLKAQAMVAALITILGIILLLSGIIVLQHSLDLHRMNDVACIPVMIIAILILGCAVVIILQPMADKFGYDSYVWWMLLVSGALSFLINIYTLIRVKLFKKKEIKAEQAAEAAQVAEAEKTEEVPSEAETPAAEADAEVSESTDEDPFLTASENGEL